MKKLFTLCTLSLLILSNCGVDRAVQEKNPQPIITTDINHFWKAYDLVLTAKDTLAQREIIQTYFLDSASVGQKRMMLERSYTADDYVKSMNEQRAFWNSFRPATEDLSSFNLQIQSGVEDFRELYPELSQATVYYTIGTHRSPGTGVDSLVMIGTEFALGKSTTVISELPSHLQSYYEINPVDHFRFLVVHEYVHTQQKGMVHNLLSLALYEGIADLVANKVTGASSPFDAFQYGAKNSERIRERFEEDMFRPNAVYNWLWNSPKNEFGTRDLGYYVGFSIASEYYDQAGNKSEALAALIELDYENEEEVGLLVDRSGYFSNSLDSLYVSYEAARPSVTKVDGIENLGKSVSPGRKTITLHFSEPMNPETRGFDFGPLGEEHVLKVQNVIGFSEDSTAFAFEVELEPGKHYQSLATNRFMSAKGMPMKAFLLDVETADN